LSGLSLAGQPRVITWLAIYFSVLIWSGISPRDFFTWVLEVTPAVIGLVLLIATRKKFPLTTLVYILILLHSIVLMVGGHYTYAEVPLFDDLSRLFGGERNNYDKLGHLMQGLVPAMVAREVLLRLQVVNGRRWLNFLVVCICLAISAVYELLEWAVAWLTGAAGDYFLGTQGYIWDTQSDMAWAMWGAIFALIIMGNFHDRQLQRLRHIS
jgi:putative membrane protein